MFRIAILTMMIIGVMTVPALAQDDPPPQTAFEQLLDADAEHNLDVAWQYFKSKKAYQAVLMRLDETIAAHPTFKKMDEVLYLAGMSSYYLWSGKGKQKLNYDLLSDEDKERYDPERLREDAEAFLGQLAEQFPESKWTGKSEDTLKELKPKD